MSMLFGVLLSVTSIFLILLVLVQRGRGGGLTGALGGMGGQSAFGSKAGDVFTKITVYTTFFWIVLCIAAVKMLGTPEEKLATDIGSSTPPRAEGATGTTPQTSGAPSTDTNTVPTKKNSAPTGTQSAPAGATAPPSAPSGNKQN